MGRSPRASRDLEQSSAGDGRTVLRARLQAPFGEVPIVTTQLTSAPDQSALRCRRAVTAYVAFAYP